MESPVLLLIVALAIGMLVLALSRGWLGRKSPKAAEGVRRGIGRGLLGFQEFVEPSVECIFQAQNVEQKEEDDDDVLGVDEEAVRSNLADALSQSSIIMRRFDVTSQPPSGLGWAGRPFSIRPLPTNCASGHTAHLPS